MTRHLPTIIAGLIILWFAIAVILPWLDRRRKYDEEQRAKMSYYLGGNEYNVVAIEHNTKRYAEAQK